MARRASILLLTLLLPAVTLAAAAMGDEAQSEDGVPAPAHAQGSSVLAVADGWATEKTAHFVFHYHPRAILRVRPIIDEAEQELERILEDLGIGDVAPIEVRIARNVKEMAFVKPGADPPGWATGMAMREGRLIVMSLTSTDDAHPTEAGTLFLHEVVHIVEWDACGGNPTPVWFSEGLAIHVSGEFGLERQKVLLTAAVRNQLLPLESLSDRYPGDGRKVNMAYAQSADVVAFIAGAYGPRLVPRLLQRVGRGDDFESALEALAGRSMRQIEAEWLDRLDVWYRWVPSITGGASLWALIAMLLVVVYVRRRKQAKMIRARWEKEEADRRRVVEEWMQENLDPSNIPRPTDDRSQVIHDGNTYPLH